MLQPRLQPSVGAAGAIQSTPMRRPNTASSYDSRLREGKTAMLTKSLLGNEGMTSRSGRELRATRSSLRMREVNTDSEDGSESDDTNGDSAKQPPPQIRRVRRNTINLYLPSSLGVMEGDLPEILVPIKLDLEIEGYRLHDGFLWNLNETKITPEDFADVFCADLALPSGPNSVRNYISQAIRSQIAEHMEVVQLVEERSRQSSKEDAIIRSGTSSLQSGNENYHTGDNELRVIIPIEIQIGPIFLRDRVEWDLGMFPIEHQQPADKQLPPSLVSSSNNNNSINGNPEEFAKTLCQDLGIGGELAPLISHSIREQVYRLQRERMEAIFEHNGNPRDGSSAITVIPPWLQQPAMETALRPLDEAELWGPSVEILSQEELEKLSMTQERALRRLRRSERSQAKPANFLPADYNVEHRQPGDERNRGQITAAYAGQMPSTYQSQYISNPRRLTETRSLQHVAGNSGGAKEPPATRQFNVRLTSEDARNWTCNHCGIGVMDTPIQRLGPDGPKTLCNACGLGWQVRNQKALPEHRRDLFRKK